MKTKMRLKHSLALLMTIVMLFSVMTPMMSFVATAIDVNLENIGSNTKLTSKTDYVIAPGITESHIITHNKDGSNQIKAFAIEIDLSNPNVGLLASYQNYMNNLAPTPTWGMQTVRDQAAAAENYYKNVQHQENFEVVGGINCDFFNMQTGAPLGSLVMNGKVYNDTKNSYFAILDDGTAVIGSGKIPENAKEVVGGSVILVENGIINPNIKGNKDKFPRTSIGIKADGSVVLVTADGRQAPSSCGQTFEENAQQMLSLGCVTALQVDGGGSATIVSQHEGETSLSVRNSPSDGTERIVSSALLVYSNVAPDGQFDHANLTPNNALYTPGSTIDFEATGVDGAGAAAELPADGTFALANPDAGTIDPATGVFTAAAGFTGDVTVNYMVGEAVKGSTTVTVVIPDTLSVASTEQAVGPGVVTDFGIIAKYNDRDVIMNADDINWTIVDSSTNADLNGVAGTFNGLTFTGAEENAYNTTVTAKLVCNEELNPLVLTVFVGSKQMPLYSFEYVTGEENKDADNYITSYSLPINGAKWLSDRGYANYRVRAQEVYDEGYPLFMWPNAAVNNDTVSADIVSAADGEPVRFGDKSLRISFDYSSFNYSSNANFYLRASAPSYAFEGSPTAIGCWVYAPEGTSNYHLYLNCASGMTVEAIEKGTAHTQQSYQRITPEEGDNVGINWTGWKYLEFDLTGTKGYTGTSNVGGSYEPYGFFPGAGVFWISYQPSKMGHASADTIYVDDITLIYGANTSDTLNPEISYIGDLADQIVDGETVYTSNTNTFKAQYADAQDKYMTGINDAATKMYIDGVDVTDKCYIDAGNDEIYFYDAVLPDGVHVIDIEVADVFGNKTTETRYFTINSKTDDTEVSFSAVNKPVLGEDFILAVKANNPANITEADIEVKVLSFYTSYWRDVTVEPAANYELVGEAVYNSIRDTLTFKVVRKADAAAENDNGVIANVITAVPADTPENLEVTHRIAKGALTYATPAEGTFTSAFSGKVVSVCEAPLVFRVDTMLVGSEGSSIYVTDTNGNVVEGAEVSYAVKEGDNFGAYTVLDTTDAEGKIFTDLFVDSVKEYALIATKQVEEKTLRSFTFKSQSYESKGDETGLPTYVKLNATAAPWNSQSISWMANPLYTAAKAVVLYAEKADYEANGDATVFTAFEGDSYLAELTSSGSIVTNYAVRFNSATITGLKENTEYVYKVSDGTTESEIKTFKTIKENTATEFFVIGDIQSGVTTDIDNVNNALTATGKDFTFGIHTGDLVDNGGNFLYWNVAGSAFSQGVLGQTDIFHALGNHEYYGDLTATNAAHYFDLPGSKDKAPEAYSVEYGNVYMASFGYIGLSAYKEAVEWLRADAAKSDATWKILVMHQPPYYTNPGGAEKGLRELITAAADEIGLDFVLSGHDHSYARTQPITSGKPDAENGTVYFICGSMGEKGYDIVNEPAHYYAKLESEYNAVYMTVKATDTTFAIETYDCLADGTSVLLDSYTATKKVTCTENGHDYLYADGWLACSVCNYTISAEGFTATVKDAATGLPVVLKDGKPVKNSWIDLNGAIYYLSENGAALSGEQKIGEYTYIFAEDGKLTKYAFVLEDGTLGTHIWLTNPATGKLCYLGDDGLPVTGAHKIACDTADGKTNLTYTFDEEGNLVKGAFSKSGILTYYWIAGLKQRNWFEIDGYWYYFDRQIGFAMATLENDGKTSVDKVKDGKYPIKSSDGSTLYFKFDNQGRLVEGALNRTENGLVYYWADNERLKGWQYVDGAVYYFGDDTYAVTGEQTIDEKVYTFAEDGKLQLKDENFALNDMFYYFDAEGKILTNHIADHPYIKVIDEAVEPQIGVTGLTAGEHCETCDMIIVAQKTVPALEDPSEPEPPTDPEPPTEPVVPYRLGDLDRNNEITAADARLALRIAAKLDPVTDSKMFVIADVNVDSLITAADARKILRVAAKIDKFF